MNYRVIVAIIAIMALAGPLFGQVKTSSMDAAIALSQRTGRPILAMAGNET